MNAHCCLRGALAITIIAAAQPAVPAQAPPPRSLQGLAGYLVGTWTGRETGRPGIGTGSRSYELILGDKFLFATNTSIFEPQEQNVNGETHEDWAMFSYDTARQTLVLRQFHIEGFVNRLVLSDATTGQDQDALVFVSEALENAPEGMRARLTYEIKGPDRFVETFELAAPGEGFEVLVTNTWSRESTAELRR